MRSRLAGAAPAAFADALLWPVAAGGKRYRPLLCFAAAEAVGAGPDAPLVLAAAGAVELVHTYSLVHDDLPCMDDDDERRGLPTVHKKWSDGVAVLVGDALLTEAFGALAECGPADRALPLVARLAQASGHRGMVGGQAWDIGLGGPITDGEGLVRLHRGKTGALIEAAVWMGAAAGGANPGQLDAAARAGAALGVAFQIADDVLDADEDAGDSGPPSYVKLYGVAGARARAEALLAEATDALAALPRADALRALARYTLSRSV
jgi:geranylgeranyl pyrophosphate synthase